jgi:hypothetical protein
MSGRPLTTDQISWLEEYRLEVAQAFTAIFAAVADRFSDGERLLRRFNEAVDSVLKGSSFRAVDEAHNELCVAKSLLKNTKPRFSSVAYEPALPGCAKIIDFRGVASDDSTLYVDVKTIKPEDKDRLEQFETALKEEWLPENVNVVLSKDWMGGEIWHGMFAARSRFLEYTLELESKIRESGLMGQAKTYFSLAFCGAGVHWREDWLEDFVDFYRNGRHRSDDPFANVEAHFVEEKKITFDSTVTRFACMKRRQGELFPASLNRNVRGPKDPEYDE